MVRGSSPRWGAKFKWCIVSYRYEINVPYIVSKFENHSLVKEKLLDLINKQDCVVENRGGDKISRTDWYVEPGSVRDYWKFIFPDIEKHMVNVFSDLNLKEYTFTNYWFQQYEHLDMHGWHRHRHCFYSSVYYIELPNDGPKTIFKHPVYGTIICPEVEEGDILTFPSILEHCSAPNQSTNRKTVLAFNVA